MSLPRLDLAARETSRWTWRAALLLADAVAWTCHHDHGTQEAAFTCARHARLTVAPQGRSPLEDALDAMAADVRRHMARLARRGRAA